MNVFKRFLNVISVGLLIYTIVALIFIVFGKHDQTHFWEKDNIQNLAEKHNLRKEYDDAFINYYLLSNKKEFTDIAKKTMEFFNNDDLDKFVKNNFNNDFNKEYEEVISTYRNIKSKIFKLENKDRDKKRKIELLKMNGIIVSLILIILLIVNYISFGKIQLFHKMRK